MYIFNNNSQPSSIGPYLTAMLIGAFNKTKHFFLPLKIIYCTQNFPAPGSVFFKGTRTICPKITTEV